MHCFHCKPIFHVHSPFLCSILHREVMFMPSIEIYSSLHTVSEANCFEHWAAKAARHKIHKNEIKKLFLTSFKEAFLPCQITMTRISPRFLDSDNLIMAFKWIKDAISEGFIPGTRAGMADNDPRMTWVYNQEKGKPKEKGTKIRFDF